MQSLGLPLAAQQHQQQQHHHHHHHQQQQQQQQFAQQQQTTFQPFQRATAQNQQYQQNDQHQHQTTTNSASPWRPQQNDAHAAAGVGSSDISLNPNSSVENIKNFITSIRSQSRPLSDEEFTRVGLKFAFRSPLDGTGVALVRGGENTAVTPYNFAEFCRLFFDQMARYESSPNGSQQQQQQPQRQSSNTPPRSLSANRPPALSAPAFDESDDQNLANAAAMGGLTSPGLGPRASPGSQQRRYSDPQDDNVAPAQQQQQQQFENNNSLVSPANLQQQLEQMPGAQVMGRDENGDMIVRLKVDTTGHSNLAQEMACYSPSHFNQGLFSPKAEGQEIDVLYPQRTPPTDAGAFASAQQQRQQQQAGNVPMTQDLQQPDPSTQLFNQQQQQGSGSPRANPPSVSGGPTHSFPPTDPAEVASHEQIFSPRFIHLQRVLLDAEDQLAGQGCTAAQIRQLLPTCLPRDEISSLGLTFALPFKERLFELTEGGQYMNVTAMNAKEFVQLVRDQRAIFDGRLNKKPSVKLIAVPQPHGGDAGREAGGFVKEKRPHMTAPAESRMTFNIDLEEAAKLVPGALAPVAVPPVIPTVSHYVNFISQHPEQFPDMFSQIRRKPELLGRWNVAWVVPDPEAAPPSNQQTMGEHNARRTGIRELTPLGASTTVRETEVEQFVQMVMAVAPELPACLRPK